MRKPRFIIVFSVIAWFGFAGESRLLSQEPATPSVPRQVKLDLIVEDKHRRSVSDIKAGDVELTQDGVIQKILYLEKVEKPVLYTLVIDTSQSLRPFLGAALTATKTFLEKNNPTDETMLVRFASSDYIETVVPFTSDKVALLNVPLQEFRLVSGQSAVLDAIYVSVDAVAKHKSNDLNFRRAVVLISDGEDRASFYNLSQITSLLQETNVQVFIIGLTSKLDEARTLIRSSARERAEKLLVKVAEYSGGRVFFVEDQGELFHAVDQIVQDLRSQYLIGFEPTIKAAAKGYQKLKLKMSATAENRNLKLITRPGFWLTPPESKKKKN
jgi:Ca-activated chloride channel family protein